MTLSNRRPWKVPVLLVASLLVVGQVTHPQERSVQENEAPEAGAKEAGPGAKLGHYAVLLGSNRVIDLGEVPRLQLVYGGSASGNYTELQAASVQGTKDQSVSLLNPYLAIMGKSKKGYTYLAQYTTTLPLYLNRQFWPSQPYQRGAFTAVMPLSRRWDADVNVSGSYGTELLRQLASLQFSPLGTQSISDTNAAVFEAGLRSVLSSRESVGLHWRRTERNSLSLNLGHAYNAIYPEPGTSYVSKYGFETGNASLSMEHSFSRRTTVHAAGRAYRVFGVTPCYSYGGDLGLSTRPTARTQVELSAGPQYNTAACGRRWTANFDASFAAELTSGTNAYLVGSRHLMVAYLVRPQWQDSAVAGINKRLTTSTSAGIDGGYVHGDRTAGIVSAYSGYFGAAYFRWMLPHGVAAVIGVRRFARLVGSSQLERNMASISLEWNSAPTSLFKF